MLDDITTNMKITNDKQNNRYLFITSHKNNKNKLAEFN